MQHGNTISTRIPDIIILSILRENIYITTSMAATCLTLFSTLLALLFYKFLAVSCYHIPVFTELWPSISHGPYKHGNDTSNNPKKETVSSCHELSDPLALQQPNKRLHLTPSVMFSNRIPIGAKHVNHSSEKNHQPA